MVRYLKKSCSGKPHEANNFLSSIIVVIAVVDFIGITAAI